MNVLIVEMYRNGVSLASALAKEPGVDKVVLITDAIDNDVWAAESLRCFPAANTTVNDVAKLAIREEIDIAANFSSIFGAAGLVETLQASGIRCVGSNREFSETEFDKRRFKHWLVKHNFRTPRIVFEDTYDEICAHAQLFDYPIVVKPDWQFGPSVQVCSDAQALKTYLDSAVQKSPATRHGAIFVIEEYIDIVDAMHVMYFLSKGASTVVDSVQTPRNWQDVSQHTNCLYSISPHPRENENSRELDRFLTLMSSQIDGHAVGAIQCGLTKSNSLYFIENNARPPTALFSQMKNCIPCFSRHGSDANFIPTNDSERYLPNKNVTVAIALMHNAEKTLVDVETLKCLPNAVYAPFSVRKEQGQFFSYRKSFPSIFLVQDSNLSRLIRRIAKAKPKIESCGDFLRIDETSIAKSIDCANFEARVSAVA